VGQSVEAAQVWISRHGGADCGWRTEVMFVPDVRTPDHLI